MKFESALTDEAVLAEVGRRLARRRIDRQMTQAALSREAGVSKRTVERVEAGASAQMQSFVRILRVLGRLRNLAGLLPEEGTRPMELLQQQKQKRKRASSRSKKKANDDQEPNWVWDDDA